MSSSTDKLYQLLPSVYRQRDAELGEPLRGLMAILEEQYQALEGDIAQLHENWFIETCEEWVVPYIADLLGLRGIEPSPDGEFSQRAFVANTLRYRRRKGTMPVIEQVAFDLTQMPAKATEGYTRLSVAQNLNHLHLDRPGTALIRPTVPASSAHTAFDELPHRPEVGRVEAGRGRYNIPNILIDLWRNQSWWHEDCDAFRVNATRYLFDSLGRELPLFNRVRNDLGLEASPLPSDVPEPLNWRRLHEELQVRRSGGGQDTDGVYFGRQPVFAITDGGTPIAPEDIYIASLQPWRVPSKGVVVDPARGRIAFAQKPKGLVRVSYASSFPGELGAGPYDRRRVQPENVAPYDITLRIGEGGLADLAAALAAWDPHAHPRARILITDNRTLKGPLTLDVTGGDLTLVADRECRPTLTDDIVVPANSKLRRLEVDGLLVGGRVDVANGLEWLSLRCCTLQPSSKPSVTVVATNLLIEIALMRCALGGIQVGRDAALVEIIDSIVDGRKNGFALASGPGPTEYGARLSVSRSTLLGPVRTKQGEFSETIFTHDVQCERVQEGCSRFSWIPFGSRVARRYRCQPVLRYTELVEVEVARLGRALTPAEDSAITRRAVRETKPHFESLDPSSSAYAQLAPSAPCAITTGAEDAGEIGSWHFVQEARRLRHLEAALEEYVRFGMEAGIFRTTITGSL